MEYRNIFLANPARLSVQREQLVIEQAEKITVPLEDISSVLIESQQVTLSVHAAAAMADHGITVFLCDEKHLPSCQLLPINQFCRYRSARWGSRCKSSFGSRSSSGKYKIRRSVCV